MAEVSKFHLLVHPGYTISKQYSNFGSTDQTKANIERMAGRWLDSIAGIANKPDHCLVLVRKSVDPELNKVLPGAAEVANPYRDLSARIVEAVHAQLGSKSLQFEDTIKRANIDKEALPNGLVKATVQGVEITYNPAQARVIAYGEHAGFYHGDIWFPGCVNFEITRFSNAFGIETSRIAVDASKSLPVNMATNGIAPVAYMSLEAWIDFPQSEIDV